MYAARNLEATATTNVFFHLKDRVKGHVMRAWRLDRGAYRALGTEERKLRRQTGGVMRGASVGATMYLQN
eukprot:scaffold102263_cov24-Tisochrysis_lutea.AAC.1